MPIKGMNVVAVLTNVKTGKKRVFKGSNLVTDHGDRWYATEAAYRATANPVYFAVAGMRLGERGGVAPDAPAKADVKVEDVGCTLVVGSGKAIDANYPMEDDGDGDNTGAGVDIVTWRVSYTTGEANDTDICSLDISDNLVTPTKAICVANFGTEFDKTNSDTLKVFVNHTMNGV